MKKLGILAIALVTTLVGITGSASAQSENIISEPEFSNVEKLDKIKQSEVEKLLDELILVRLEQSQTYKTINAGELEKKDKELLNELKNKGVRPLSEDEIEILNKSTIAQDNNIQPLASSPPTWGPYANVDMLTYGEKTVTVNGKTYKEWINYAVPKSGGGAPLVKHYASVKLMDEPFETAKFVNKVFNILLQRAIGEIKYVSWTPYDYFWPEGKDYTSFNTYDLLVSYATKMKYVWVYTASTDLWQLKASANSVQTTENHVIRGYKNGSLSNVTRTKYNTAWSDDYDSIETIAATAGFTFTSPVKTMKFTKVDGGTALSFFPYYASGPADLY
ncbi:hypothetical protein P4H83_29400 [Paenibacillus favisporus]|uniref:hypothetical protein n=1 Tax=Paenibacillus favisporus TaxID=221028 RepID=UPI002DBB99B0|nr:hypothetical protein [Paenibacillus favisporus]MEC0179002.1 hypothetical protein [Paenibacillus favisporus]